MSDTPVTPISERIRQALEGMQQFVADSTATAALPGWDPISAAIRDETIEMARRMCTLLAEALAEIDRQAQVIAERDATIAELRALLDWRRHLLASPSASPEETQP